MEQVGVCVFFYVCWFLPPLTEKLCRIKLGNREQAQFLWERTKKFVKKKEEKKMQKTKQKEIQERGEIHKQNLFHYF